MAVDVGKSPSEASLSGDAEDDGKWDCTEVEMDYPELADSLHQLLGPEEATSCPQGTEGVAVRVSQGSSSYPREESSAPAPKLSRARASLPETQTSLHRATDGADVPPRGSHWFLSSEEQQQVKTTGCWEPVSSPPSQHSSTEESILAGSCHDACTSLGRRWRDQSLYPSTPELLCPQSPLSPRGAPRSRSASCFSVLSSEEGASEEPSGSLLTSTDLPSPAAPCPRGLCCHRGAAKDRALRMCRSFSPLLDGHRTTERIREMSYYQANYWACAIPESLPPSPDRRSPHWNPNKEYEDLLDYAYPLKPRYKLGKVPEPFLHDSGIGLDSFSASLEGTSRSASIYGRGGQAQGGGGNGHHRLVASVERCSTPGPGRRGCSEASLCCEPLPAAEEFSFRRRASSHSSRSSAKDLTAESAGLGSSGHPAADGRSWHARGSSFLSHKGQVKSTHRFLPTTAVLPLRKEWDADEEFLSLPPRLLELDGLARFLSSLSLTVRMPVQSHQNPPHHPDSRQLPASRAALGGEACGRDRRGNAGHYGGLGHPCSPHKPSWDNSELCGRIHRDPLQGLHLAAGLRDTLDETYLNEPWVKGHPKKSHEGESLAQCVKMFCWQLEELIRWLYNVVDTAGSWHPVSSGTEGMKALLHRYLVGVRTAFSSPSGMLWTASSMKEKAAGMLQEFRKDVASHRSLTKSVLERGEALLDCMAVSSPALKDTLGLIVKQSEELEIHAEHLYESVLAAAGKDRVEDKEGTAESCSVGAASITPGLG